MGVIEFVFLLAVGIAVGGVLVGLIKYRRSTDEAEARIALDAMRASARIRAAGREARRDIYRLYREGAAKERSYDIEVIDVEDDLDIR